jgi:hypothetical protein
VVDLDAAFGQQLLHVSVGETEAQIPPDGQHYHRGREPDPENADS